MRLARSAQPDSSVVRRSPPKPRALRDEPGLTLNAACDAPRPCANAVRAATSARWTPWLRCADRTKPPTGGHVAAGCPAPRSPRRDRRGCDEQPMGRRGVGLETAPQALALGLADLVRSPTASSVDARRSVTTRTAIVATCGRRRAERRPGPASRTGSLAALLDDSRSLRAGRGRAPGRLRPAPGEPAGRAGRRARSGRSGRRGAAAGSCRSRSRSPGTFPGWHKAKPPPPAPHRRPRCRHRGSGRAGKPTKMRPRLGRHSSLTALPGRVI